MRGVKQAGSLSWGRVALLGIAQRQVCIPYAGSGLPKSVPKQLDDSKLTIGEWIRMKREQKRLARFQLAQRMGIASTLVRAWEAGNALPDEVQLALVREVLT